MIRERILWSVYFAVFGALAGAVAAAIVGVVIGLLFWITGFGFTYHWADWPLAGAMFGLVTGAIGGGGMGATIGAFAFDHQYSLRRTVQIGAWIVAASLSASLGFSLFREISTSLVIAFFGAIGSLIGSATARRVCHPPKPSDR